MTEFDEERLSVLYGKYVKSGKDEVETAVICDLLKEYDRKKFATITTKDVQSHIDFDKYGYVCYSSLENFARNYFINDPCLLLFIGMQLLVKVISKFYTKLHDVVKDRMFLSKEVLVNHGETITNTLSAPTTNSDTIQ